MTSAFEVNLAGLQPSQLYICKEKLSRVMAAAAEGALDPVPLKRLAERLVITDGHTRAVAAAILGHEKIRVVWETEELDWTAYEICVDWCLHEGVHSVADMVSRIVPMDQYEELWYKRCRAMHETLRQKRGAHNNAAKKGIARNG